MGSLPQPGSPDYVPSLIRHLGEEPSLAGWQPDPGLFAALLLTLIVNKGGMVVDVPSSEGKISRVVEHVCAVSPPTILRIVIAHSNRLNLAPTVDDPLNIRPQNPYHALGTRHLSGGSDASVHG
jgi:hypothetical protein